MSNNAAAMVDWEIGIGFLRAERLTVLGFRFNLAD
jgi:hypothetical protein